MSWSCFYRFYLLTDNCHSSCCPRSCAHRSVSIALFLSLSLSLVCLPPSPSLSCLPMVCFYECHPLFSLPLSRSYLFYPATVPLSLSLVFLPVPVCSLRVPLSAWRVPPSILSLSLSLVCLPLSLSLSSTSSLVSLQKKVANFGSYSQYLVAAYTGIASNLYAWGVLRYNIVSSIMQYSTYNFDIPCGAGVAGRSSIS